MATKKKAKAKSKAKRKPAPARKPAARKKPAKKKTAPKRAPAGKKTKPKAPPAAKPAPAAPAGERIGVVTHYFSHLSVAVVKLERGRLHVGDTIHFKGHTTDFSQRVASLQVDHQTVNEVGPDDDFGLQVSEHAREGDIVYKT